MLDVGQNSTGGNILHPETPFGNSDDIKNLSQQKLDEISNKNRETLKILFRRYSRCDDIGLPYSEHASNITRRFNIMMNRSLERPALFERLRKKVWGFVELGYQTKNSTPSNIDLGIINNSAVSEVLKELRHDVQSGTVRFPNFPAPTQG
ncbi:MAG: hypothetical protein DI586_07050 [Micavibrio aeruginosavorus]|uniref:Uncharacterized protein n=1 Tax=Micavibrio aeruginosavorus TaxID=349221 RepID=A0A2W5HI88_9BACT|nr:MAG: hypothetical protein DI586_07050 [Micavibrio aeruginosavorus]